MIRYSEKRGKNIMITFGQEGFKPQHQSLINEFVNNMIEYFDIDDSEADIDIVLTNRCDGDAGGYCHGDDEQIEIELATHVQDYQIPFDRLMINLAHEMVHAKQLIKRELCDKGVVGVTNTPEKIGLSMKQIWKGEAFIDCPYWQQPWEKEAYSMEKEVFKACFPIGMTL
jgi:hypothetical protein